MRKCIKTRFYPLQTVKNIFFQNIFLVIWKYAKMHQNTFLSTPDVQKHLFWKKDYGGLEVCANASKHVFYHSRRSKISFLTKQFLVGWKYAQMRQNTFLTTPDSKNIQTVKNIFFQIIFLVVWEYAQMHQNTFLTTTDVLKHLFWKKDFGGLEVCANA